MSRNLSDEEELLKEFERMLGSKIDEDEDFGHYYPPSWVNHPKVPTKKDLEYPEVEPPPIPKKAKCKHENKKKVIISANLKYWFCPDCKADLGDIE